MSEPGQEDEVTPPIIDPMLLGLVHQRVIEQQATPGDLSVATVEMEPSVLLEQHWSRVEISQSLRRSCLQSRQLFLAPQLLTWWRPSRLVRRRLQLGWYLRLASDSWRLFLWRLLFEDCSNNCGPNNRKVIYNSLASAEPSCIHYPFTDKGRLQRLIHQGASGRLL